MRGIFRGVGCQNLVFWAIFFPICYDFLRKNQKSLSKNFWIHMVRYPRSHSAQTSQSAQGLMGIEPIFSKDSSSFSSMIFLTNSIFNS